MLSTLQDVVKAVRELSYDRFPIPILGLKQKASYSFQMVAASGNRATLLRMIPTVGSPTDYSFATYQTLEGLFEKLVSDGIVVAQLPFYRGDKTIANSFYPKASTSLAEMDQYVTSISYYNDDDIKVFILEYITKVLAVVDVTDVSQIEDTITEIVALTTGQSILRHMIFFCALWMISYRRLLEYANVNTPIVYSDGTGISLNSEPPSRLAYNDLETRGDSISVNVGGVFNLNDEQPEGQQTATNANGNWQQGTAGMPGTELFFNDEHSFWYRYFCFVRSRLENAYGDFSFRQDSGVWGHSTLTRDLNYRTFFDSYPFTLSPTIRGI